MTVLVSACLLGVPCRYDGQSKRHPLAQELCRRHRGIPVYKWGYLRPHSWMMARRGVELEMVHFVSPPYTSQQAQDKVLELARLTGAEAAVLKERSPSCGSGAVYDGTFSGTLTAGWGAAAGLLREQGIRVLGESRLEELLRQDVR